MITIAHFIEPLVDSFLKYGDGLGQLVPTIRSPHGVWVHVKIAPLIADLEGARKVSGFLTVGANLFCSFCLCTSEQMADVNLLAWRLRDGAEVRAQANMWLNTATKSGREALATQHGVRWSPLLRLPYWDPVKHVLLGFMHNWLEGILEDHLRILWGIGSPDDVKKAVVEMEKDEEISATDVSDSASELEDLRREAAEAAEEAGNAMEEDPPMSPSTSQSSVSSSSSATLSSSSATPTPDGYQQNPYQFDVPHEMDDDDDPSKDPDYVDSANLFFSFTDSQLAAIRGCIAGISLPTWVQRPPANLGEKAHGKLKAHELLSLFSCIFPLVIPEFWHIPGATELDLTHLQSFHHLVAATNIVCSFKTSNQAADVYTHHYIQYRLSIRTLFPQFHQRPNHHMAMHNGAQMKYWGPLPSLSEFPGERMNGMLQNINTNRRLRTSFIILPKI
jgi:hypothetical protein